MRTTFNRSHTDHKITAIVSYQDEVDPLALDPLDLISVADEATDAFGGADEAADSTTLIRQEYAAGGGSGRLMADSLMVFPSRQDRINPAAVSRIQVKDTDFDGDEIELDDFWQETIRVPKVGSVGCCGACGSKAGLWRVCGRCSWGHLGLLMPQSQGSGVGCRASGWVDEGWHGCGSTACTWSCG